MKQWFAGHMNTNFLNFKKGEQVYYRKAVTETPLQGGNFFIVFSPVKMKSFRFFDAFRVSEFLEPWPNRVHPAPAPADKNAEVEVAYRAFLKKHPLGDRYSAEERDRIREERSLNRPQL